MKKMIMTIEEIDITATLVKNSSTEKLLELLADGPITMEMQDYAGIEKVGDLGASLPRNDEQISTRAGDLILYQGREFVIYYGPNSWNFTRLGRIDEIDQKGLKSILGSGNVTVKLSLK